MDRKRGTSIEYESAESNKEILTDQNNDPKVIDLFKAWPYPLLLFVFAIWQCRRLTHIAWLGSGWPQWVAGPDRAEDFDRELNSLHSICSLTMIAFNLIPGTLVDFCKKKFHRPDNEFHGTAVGLTIMFTFTTLCMITHRLVIERIFDGLYVS